MKSTRTNLTVNIQFDNVQDVERVLYKILNELSGPSKYGQGSEDRLTYQYAMERWTEEANTNGTITRTYESKLNDNGDDI